MAEQGDSPTYVFTQEAVRRALKALQAVSIHEHFAGYLSVLRGLSGSSASSVRSTAIWDFHRRYLRASAGDDQTVFVSPFASRGSSGLHVINRNIAGSYGPSSMREGKPLAGVLDVYGTGAKATYSLKSDHARLASDKLLKGRKVPVVALSVFLYRDFGLRLEAPEISRVVTLFRTEFGFPIAKPNARQDSTNQLLNDEDADENLDENVSALFLTDDDLDQGFSTLFFNDEVEFGSDDLELAPTHG